jgi:hypothetical protein
MLTKREIKLIQAIRELDSMNYFDDASLILADYGEECFDMIEDRQEDRKCLIYKLCEELGIDHRLDTASENPDYGFKTTQEIKENLNN